MAFTLVGPAYHPGAAWAPLSLTAGAGPVYVAAAGTNADDDFSASKTFGGAGAGRWGDYTAAVSDRSGTVWMGTEYISGGNRTAYANWATYIAHVTPPTPSSAGAGSPVAGSEPVRRLLFSPGPMQTGGRGGFGGRLLED